MCELYDLFHFLQIIGELEKPHYIPLQTKFTAQIKSVLQNRFFCVITISKYHIELKYKNLLKRVTKYTLNHSSTNPVHIGPYNL